MTDRKDHDEVVLRDAEHDLVTPGKV